MPQQIELICWPSRDRLFWLSRDFNGALHANIMCKRLAGYIDGPGSSILLSAARWLDQEHESTVAQWLESQADGEAGKP
jgi:hypothetical protein